ncbi:MAG: ATP-binding protein, partial [Bacteroidales bacterium]|nr:ATP-binding protein [Bacteroidales bacterium]
NNVSVSIQDTGVGISPEDLKKLFKITEKHTSPGTENEKGSGLGLILCKEFIAMHDGEICVDSEVGKGSIFKFTLPLNRSL